MKKQLDPRYTISREFCGYVSKKYVIRFCDKWLGKAHTKGAAETIARKHQKERGKILGKTVS